MLGSDKRFGLYVASKADTCNPRASGYCWQGTSEEPRARGGAFLAKRQYALVGNRT
jgi:hypothetical protein